jgi:hypothetical protein
VSVDSPRICFSPLRIKDSIEEAEEGAAIEAAQILHNLPRSVGSKNIQILVGNCV